VRHVLFLQPDVLVGGGLSGSSACCWGWGIHYVLVHVHLQDACMCAYSDIGFLERPISCLDLVISTSLRASKELNQATRVLVRLWGHCGPPSPCRKGK